MARNLPQTAGDAAEARRKVFRRSRGRSGGQFGFSLGELMAAMAVLGIAGLGTMPGLSKMIKSASLNGTARQVLVELERARAEAIMRNTRCRIEIDDQGQMALYRYDSTNLAWEDTPALTSKPGHDAGLTLEASGEIVFAANGTVPTTGTVVVRSSDGRARTISVSAAGTVRIL